MATIPGSQFDATAPGLPVTIVETATGAGVPPAVSGAFNLEVFVGAGTPAATAPGYQGTAVLSPNGRELDLISGAFAVTDNGSGNDTLSAFGNNETIGGGSAGTGLNLFGIGDVANGGAGQDTINVFGSADTVNGGPGNDTINVFNSGNFVAPGAGNDLINAFGSADTVTAGAGNDTINAVGDGFIIAGGSGNAAINVVGNANIVAAGTGNDTIAVNGLDNFVSLGAGNDTVFLSGNSDTVMSGAAAGSHGQISLSGTNMVLSDGPNQYADTVVGFDQAGGDRIHLTTDTVANAVGNSTQVNGGADTLITLSDGSTLLLKGVTHIDNTFFN